LPESAFLINLRKGMLGLKSNPVLDSINAEVDRYAQQQKLQQAEREALRKQAIEDAKFKMQQVMNNSKLKMNQAALAKTLQDMQLAQEQAGQKQMQAIMLGEINRGDGMSMEEVSLLDKETRDRLVPLPGSTRQVAAANKDTANKLRDYVNEIGPPKDSIDRIINSIESGEFNKFRLLPRARMNTELASVIGALRVPITGPGVLSEPDKQMIRDVVGEPTKLLTFSALELEKLKTIQNKLENDIRKRYQQAGIDLPKDERQRKIESFQKKYPGLSPRKVEELVNKFYGQ
jgi:hypothetical protein